MEFFDDFSCFEDVLDYCTENINMAYNIIKECIEFRSLHTDVDLPDDLKFKLIIATSIIENYKLIIKNEN